MKLSTYVKAYKLALSSVCEKVPDWKSMYLGYVEFPTDVDYKVSFVFSNSSTMEAGSLGISASIGLTNIERVSGGLDEIPQISEAISRDIKINDVGRVLVTLFNLLNRLKDQLSDWEDTDITNTWFDTDKGFVYFELNKFKQTVQTDGHLFLFGDPLDE